MGDATAVQGSPLPRIHWHPPVDSSNAVLLSCACRLHLLLPAAARLPRPLAHLCLEHLTVQLSKTMHDFLVLCYK